MDDIDLAELFHENSKARPELGVPPGAMNTGQDFALALMDGSVKRYPDASVIALPDPELSAGTDLFQAIRHRTSVREFHPVPVSLKELAQLLFYGSGIRAVERERGYRNYRRNAPSAGNLGSVDLYPVVLRVVGISPGVYHYDPLEHRLDHIGADDLNGRLNEFVLQPGFDAAGLVIALGSSLGRIRAKYGIRGYRYACIDAGHVAQNLALVASALGLGACPLGSFDDDAMNRLVGLDGLNEAVLYVVAVGLVT